MIPSLFIFKKRFVCCFFQMKQQQRLMKLGVNPKLTVTPASSAQQQQSRPQPPQQPRPQASQHPKPQPAHQSKPQAPQQPRPQPAHQPRPQIPQQLSGPQMSQQPRPQPAHQQSQRPQSMGDLTAGKSLLKPQATPSGMTR